MLINEALSSGKEVILDEGLNTAGHLFVTMGAWLVSHWTQVGAGVLMILQALVLINKIRNQMLIRKIKRREYEQQALRKGRRDRKAS